MFHIDSLSPDEDRARVTQLSLALTALNTTSSQVESLVMSSYSRANQERVQTDSLTESVQGSRQSVQRLLTLVNDYVVSHVVVIIILLSR